MGCGGWYGAVSRDGHSHCEHPCYGLCMRQLTACQPCGSHTLHHCHGFMGSMPMCPVLQQHDHPGCCALAATRHHLAWCCSYSHDQSQLSATPGVALARPSRGRQARISPATQEQQHQGRRRHTVQYMHRLDKEWPKHSERGGSQATICSWRDCSATTCRVTHRAVSIFGRYTDA